MKKTIIKYSSITQSIASFVFLMGDEKEASMFLFNMVSKAFENHEDDEEKVEDIKLFILDIVYEISKIDHEYSDKMAIEYFNLI